MNTGMQDAFNLSWKLALVCRGEGAADPLLESYSPERSSVGDMVLKATGMMTTVAVMRGEVKQSIRNHVAGLVFGLPAVREKMANTMTELSIGYPKSPLNGNGSHAGERAPIRKGEVPVGSGGVPRFVLFGEDEQLTREFPELVEPVVRKPFREGELWLVRPDGYVAVSSREEGDVRGFLEAISLG